MANTAYHGETSPVERSDHDMQVYDVTQINRHRKQRNLVAVTAMIINSYQMAKCADPGQTARSEQPDQGLHS